MQHLLSIPLKLPHKFACLVRYDVEHWKLWTVLFYFWSKNWEFQGKKRNLFISAYVCYQWVEICCYQLKSFLSLFLFWGIKQQMKWSHDSQCLLVFNLSSLSHDIT